MCAFELDAHKLFEVESARPLEHLLDLFLMSLGCMVGFIWCTITTAFGLISGFGSLVLIICLWFVYHNEDCKLYVGSFLSFFVGSIDWFWSMV